MVKKASRENRPAAFSGGEKKHLGNITQTNFLERKGKCGNHTSCTEPINSTRCSFYRGGECVCKKLGRIRITQMKTLDLDQPDAFPNPGKSLGRRFNLDALFNLPKKCIWVNFPRCFSSPPENECIWAIFPRCFFTTRKMHLGDVF